MKLSTAEVLDVNVGLAWLKDVRVTSYDAVDQLLGSQAQDDEVRRLNQVFDIACKLEQRRKIVGGAFVAPYLRASAHISPDLSPLGDSPLQDNDGLYSISRGYPEIDIIKPSLVEAGIGPSQTKSRGMVAELMILAGRIASVYASANDLPLYFRTQAKPSAAEDLAKLERMKDDEGIVGYRDLLASGVRISAASASDMPGEHFSMGIGTLAELEHPSDDMLKGSGYVRATSPLRRYPDLVAHWQIKAALAGTKLPFDRETIRADIPRIVRMDAWHRALERSSQRFWMTVKLARVFESCESQAKPPCFQQLQLLVRAYQVRGHRIAKLDPLGINGLTEETTPDELKIEHYGWSQSDLSREMRLGPGLLPNFVKHGVQKMTIGEIIDACKRMYCEAIGIQYVHIPDREKCDWLRERIEMPEPFKYSIEEKRTILDRLIWSDSFERFISSKYPNEKRFGLEGGESLIPGVKTLIDRSVDYGVNSITIGMPHRGRLNVLANVIRRPIEGILNQFAGTDDDGEGGGDVKYHLGANYVRPRPRARRWLFRSSPPFAPRGRGPSRAG
ncbi:hypothetical protein L7F22_007844 [Adiantum nelumboides]|nr:hypothetical protein [Adiantum nelumboides]